MTRAVLDWLGDHRDQDWFMHCVFLRPHPPVITPEPYNALYDPADIQTARWLTFPDENTRKNFERDQSARLAEDVDGNPVFLAPNRPVLQVTMERWPKVGFHAVREHGQRMAQG